MMRKLLCLVALVATVSGYCGKREFRNIEVLMRPPPVVEVIVGESVSIVCSAHGHNMNDPLVYWVKGVGPDYTKKGKALPGTSIGKSVFSIEEVEAEDIDSYKCVIEDCCGEPKIEIAFELVVPDDTCKDVYGVGNVVYGATWAYKSWPDAVKDCKSKGMELALPKNAIENALLLHDMMISFNTHPNANKFSRENWLWLGAHDNNWEGIWQTSKKDEFLTFTNWDRKQPDNKITDADHFPSDTQNVAGIHRGSGRWDDSYMHFKRAYVCLCPEREDVAPIAAVDAQ